MYLMTGRMTLADAGRLSCGCGSARGAVSGAVTAGAEGRRSGGSGWSAAADRCRSGRRRKEEPGSCAA
jgi:hypothetical protein